MFNNCTFKLLQKFIIDLPSLLLNDLLNLQIIITVRYYIVIKYKYDLILYVFEGI